MGVGVGFGLAGGLVVALGLAVGVGLVVGIRVSGRVSGRRTGQQRLRNLFIIGMFPNYSTLLSSLCVRMLRLKVTTACWSQGSLLLLLHLFTSNRYFTDSLVHVWRRVRGKHLWVGTGGITPDLCGNLRLFTADLFPACFNHSHPTNPCCLWWWRWRSAIFVLGGY